MGNNTYFSKIQVQTPTLEICKDPEKLAALLTKMQQQINTEFRRFRVIKCPNVLNAYHSPTTGTPVSIPNPGFSVGAVFFSHAIPTKLGYGDSSAQPPIVAGAGYLLNLTFQANGPITFKPVIPNSGSNSTQPAFFDVYVVVMEGEGTAK